MLLTVYILLAITSIIVCITLESKGKSKVLFGLVFAMGVFFTIQIGRIIAVKIGMIASVGSSPN